MQKTLSEQIQAIQQSRKLILLVPSYHVGKEKVPDLLAQTDQALNDAGATISILKIVGSDFNAVPDTPENLEKRKAIAYNFFVALTQS